MRDVAFGPAEMPLVCREAVRAGARPPFSACTITGKAAWGAARGRAAWRSAANLAVWAAERARKDAAVEGCADARRAERSNTASPTARRERLRRTGGRAGMAGQAQPVAP